MSACVDSCGGATAFADDEHQGKKRHRRHANPFTLRGPMQALSRLELFGREAPLALDVGCGPGEFSCALAARHPELDVLGVEIRAHLVAQLNAQARAQSLHNCRGLLANANLQLTTILPRKSVAFVSVNFPDPWYKKRHHKRRVVNPSWLVALEPLLQDDAQIHVMTDYEPLAWAMREALDAAPYLEACTHGWAQYSTTGLSSERERTHLGRQEPIYRLAYRHVLRGRVQGA